MENLFNYFSWFNSKSSGQHTFDMTKHDLIEMKDANDALSQKAQENLLQTPEIVDRRVVMLFEKKFRDKFKKIGNLDQKCPYCAQGYKSLHLGDKKCLSCKKTFLVQKRVQDMATVAFKQENNIKFEIHWKAVSSTRKFKLYLPNEYAYIQKHLEKQGKRNLKQNDIMHALIDAYAKNSISNGHYQLYSSFLFYKAELLRSEQRFAEALTYYFYVHFLHNNGVDNSAGFNTAQVMNEELKARITDLLALGNMQIKKVKELFDYSILSLNKFSTTKLNVNMHKSYSLLLKEFKDIDAQKDGVKPMRSFVLYTNTKAS